MRTWCAYTLGGASTWSMRGLGIQAHWRAIRDSGRDGQIRTADLSLRRRPLYPSELRPRILSLLILKYFDVRRLLHSVISATKMYQNCIRTPLHRRSCIKTPPNFTCLAVHLLQRFSLHLEFHLRVLLEHLGVPLTKKLRDPFIRHAAGTKPGSVARTKIIQPKVLNTSSPQSRFPGPEISI